jgi:hypothetical protein
VARSSSFPIIFAGGRLTSSGMLIEHSRYGDGRIDALVGGDQADIEDGTDQNNKTLLDVSLD